MGKGKKIQKQLARRLAQWDSLPTGSALHRGRVKVIHGLTFRRPGSLNQRK